MKAAMDLVLILGGYLALTAGAMVLIAIPFTLLWLVVRTVRHAWAL